MTMLDNATALVFNTDDLREAVSTDNGIDTVFFGADFTLAYGITIYPGKPSLVIDGTYEGVRHTFTDINDSDASHTIGIRSVSNIVVTFQNIDLIGRNFYGIPYVPNGSIYNGVSTIYQNVTYTGTQISHNPYGLVRYIDCDITVNSHEAAEATHIEIGGVTNIVKTNMSNAVFWFYGTGTRRPYLKILSGGEVTITTAHYFMYENYPPDYILEPGASFTLNTNSGISYSTAHTVNSFLADESSSFFYTQTANRGFASLYLDGELSVNQNAKFYMQADFSNVNRLIRFTGSSGGMYLNNPKSFALYNKGNASATAFYFSSAIPVEITGGQVNQWDTAMDFPAAGTFADIPPRKWKRPDWTPFTLRGTASNSQTIITFNNFTPEELAPLPPLSELSLHQTPVFSVGNINLDIYSAVLTRRVTGLTEPYANVKIEYIPSYYEDPQEAVADETGLFTLVPRNPVPFSEYIEVFANTPFLIVSVPKDIYEADGLFIKYAPARISFPFRPMPGFPYTALPRDIPDDPVVIVDTRDPKTPWRLWANISGPLKTEDNDILTDGVVFVTQSGTAETLGEQPIPVRLDGPYETDETTIIWEEDEGVIARITVPVRSGKRYTTQMGWAVYPEDEAPEGGG